MKKIADLVAKELWRIYRKKNPQLPEEELFVLIWKDILQAKADGKII